MRRFFLAVTLCSLFLAAAYAEKEKPSDLQEPVAFGMLSQNAGCVIFREYRKTSGMFWGVAVTTKTVSKIEVIETQGYTLNKQLWDETQMDDMNELQRIATKDKIKFVKIPNKKPTADQLEKARSMCKESS
jgi:hypothetical protein